MWGNVDKTIQIIESRIDLISKTTYLYDTQYCSKDNEDFLLKYSHIIGEFVPMKKPFEFAYGLKYQCTYLNERLYKLEGCLNLRLNNKMKAFPNGGNVFILLFNLKLIQPSNLYNRSLRYVHWYLNPYANSNGFFIGTNSSIV